MITGIIQARMDSTRLPGKTMLPVCGKSLLEHMIDRVKHSKTIQKIVVATTTNKIDELIVNFCESNKIEFVRGSHDDVLSRYKLASDFSNADVIVRLTSDCPLIDPNVIDKGVKIFQNNEYDFVSNVTPLPRTYPIGMDVEILSSSILTVAAQNAKKPSEREHVTFYIRRQPKKFKIYRFDYVKDISDYRLVVDYEVDYLVIKSIIEGLYPKKKEFTLEHIINWLEQNPEIKKLNEKIQPGQGWLKSFQEDEKLGFKSSSDDPRYV